MATGTRKRARPLTRTSIAGGGTAGNQELTALVAVVLTVLLLVLGVTILRVKQLIWVHLFIGFLLIGPVLAKLGSTGYRFIRYYAGDPEYRRKGPPELYLRASAPVLVCTTLAVFASGVVLMALGPADRGNWVEIHKVTFIAWGVLFALHFLGHLAEMPRSLRAVHRANRIYGARSPGDAGRWIVLTGALVAGAVLAVVLIPEFHTWTAAGAFPHHHHHFG